MRIALVIARAWPRPVGSGAEMWNASAVSAPPRTSAIGVAPRLSACSALSTTITPAPSPSTNPSRVRSNGREAVSGESFRFESAVMFASAATPIGQIGASVPPVRTTSASPVAMSRSASWNAMTDVAQAATCVMTGPVSLYSIESMQPAIEPDSAGTANADTNRGPFWSWTWVPSMIDSMPPPPVFMTTATRSRCSTVMAAKSMPLEATASRPAPMPRWMKRVMRRAILGSMTVAGSKSRTSAAIRTSCALASNERIRRVPVTAFWRFDQ